MYSPALSCGFRVSCSGVLMVPLWRRWDSAIGVMSNPCEDSLIQAQPQKSVYLLGLFLRIQGQVFIAHQQIPTPQPCGFSEGWSPQNTRYLCKFSLSASGPRTVVGGRWRSRSSRPWIYQQKQSCGRREWLWGLSPNGWFANLIGGLLKVYVGRLSLGYALFLWPRGFVLGKPERLVWGSRPGTFLGTRLHPVGLLDSPLHLPGRQAACTERDWSCDGKSLRSCDPVVRGECSSPGSWSHSCKDWVGGLGRLPEELCHPRPFADGYLNWWRPVAHGKGAQNIKYARMLIEKLSGKWGATAGLRKQKDVLSRGGSTSLIRDAAVIAERFPSLLWGREEEKVRFMALNLRGHYKATKDPISSASSLINHLFGYENTRSCNLGKRHHIISTKTLIKSSAIQKPILPTEMYSSNNVVLKTWIASFLWW